MSKRNTVQYNLTKEETAEFHRRRKEEGHSTMSSYGKWCFLQDVKRERNNKKK